MTSSVSASDPPTGEPPGKPSLRQRLSELFAEYGRIAITTFIVLWLVTLAAFSTAFAVGLAPTTSTGVFGTIGAGWLATKATMPLRILATLAITPGIAYLVTRRRRRAEANADANTEAKIDARVDAGGSATPG